jgi:hypothetical protein
MHASRFFARTPLLVLAIVTWGAACAQSDNNEMLTKHDFAGTGPYDFAGDDLYGVDLYGFPGTDDMLDMSVTGDLSRLTWSDKSFTTTGSLWSVWSNGTTVWAVGDNATILSSTGGVAFDNVKAASVPDTTTSLYGIFGIGAGPSAMLTVGSNGAAWTYAMAPTAHWVAYPPTNGAGDGNTATWIAPDGQIFTVGTNGTAKKLNTMGSWDDIGGMDVTANAVWGIKTATGYTVYACGNYPSGGEGRIWKYTGTTYVPETSGATGSALYGIYGFAENDIYAVGEHSLILHSTGDGTWTPQTVPTLPGTTKALNAIGGASADEIYAVGDAGVIVQKYGAASTSWTLVTTTATQNFLGVWANAAQVWAVGAMGQIFTK